MFQIQFPARLNTQLTVSAMRVAMSATSVFWLSAGNFPWGAVGSACVCLSFIPGLLIRNNRLVNAGTACLTAMLCSHVVLGMHADLYETSQLYDKTAHALGCAAIAGVVWPALLKYGESRLVSFPASAIAVSTLGIVISLGTAWEIFEFTIDRTGLFQTQRGLMDTMLDLIANAIGAAASVSIHFRLAKRRSTPQLPLTHQQRQA